MFFVSNGWVTIPLSIFFVLFCSCVLQASVFFSGAGGGGGGGGLGCRERGECIFHFFNHPQGQSNSGGGGGAGV